MFLDENLSRQQCVVTAEAKHVSFTHTQGRLLLLLRIYFQGKLEEPLHSQRRTFWKYRFSSKKLIFFESNSFFVFYSDVELEVDLQCSADETTQLIITNSLSFISVVEEINPNESRSRSGRKSSFTVSLSVNVQLEYCASYNAHGYTK